MNKGYWEAQNSTTALICCAIEAACIFIGMYYSWTAGVAVIVAILTQAGWQTYLLEKEKE